MIDITVMMSSNPAIKYGPIERLGQQQNDGPDMAKAMFLVRPLLDQIGPKIVLGRKPVGFFEGSKWIQFPS